MMVRRYVVKDMPEAIGLIRKDLGKDAVILGTKKISMKKWFGLWRSKRIEVLAATGDGVPARAVPERSQVQHQSRTPSRAPAAPTETKAAAVGAPSAGFVTSPVAIETEGMSPAQSAPPGVTPAAALSAVVDSDGRLQLDDVYKEISDVKKLLRSKLSASLDDPLEDAMFRHLIRQGMSEEQVRGLFAAVSYTTLSSDPSNSASAAETGSEIGFRDALGARILERLQELCNPEPIAPTSRIVALVGPTGVGKTTTIAKLAALHVLSGQRKVGLITTDTFRIAAVEQLRTYANILHVPLEVVYQPSELHSALGALSDCDLILMDTAGRNFRLERNVLEMKHILAAVPVDETVLVLSMTSKPEDLDRVAGVFQELPVDKFLFTKMDETSTYGAILNLLMTYRKPVSYVTTGQNVPDDIEVANLEKVVRLIFGGAA